VLFSVRQPHLYVVVICIFSVRCFRYLLQCCVCCWH